MSSRSELEDTTCCAVLSSLVQQMCRDECNRADILTFLLVSISENVLYRLYTVVTEISWQVYF